MRVRRAGDGTANLIAAGFALTAVTYGLARFAYGLFLPQIRDELGLGTVTAGWIGSAAFVSYCIAVVVAFLAMPRWGARRVGLAAGCCATAGLALVAVAGSAFPLAVAIALAGVSTGLASPPLAAAVAQNVRAAGRPRANGTINAGTAAGIMLSGLGALVFADAWRELYVAFAGIGAAVTLWLWQAVPAGTGAGPLPPRPRIWRQGLIPLFIAAAFMGAASTTVWTFGAEILRRDADFQDRHVAVAWMVLGAVGVAGVVTGSGTDRFGIGAIHRLSLALMSVALGGLAVSSLSATLPFVAMGMFGAGYMISTGALLLWGITLFPERADIGLGLPFLMIAVGQAAGAPIFAMILDHAGTTTALGVAISAMACAAIPRPRTHRVA